MIKEIFDDNKNIVINTDIDGILSGLILVKTLGCKIVGFTNSKEYVWLTEERNDLYANVYVDMFVTDDSAICVDQHIVAISEEHQKKIIKSGNKYSPQIDGNRIYTTTGFKNKYPFGSTHYLIAKLESEGVSVNLPDLNKPILYKGLKFGDLLLRADDAMATTLYHYVPNATYWWNWLKTISPTSQNILNMIQYLDDVKSTIRKRIDSDGLKHKKGEYLKEFEIVAKQTKKIIQEYFHTQFDCKTGDGGFRNVTDDTGKMLPNIRKYILAIAKLLDIDDLDLPEQYIRHEGTYHRCSWLPYFHKDLLNDYTFQGHKIFSYAFIYSPSEIGEINFSFTLDMK